MREKNSFEEHLEHMATLLKRGLTLVAVVTIAAVAYTTFKPGPEDTASALDEITTRINSMSVSLDRSQARLEKVIYRETHKRHFLKHVTDSPNKILTTTTEKPTYTMVAEMDLRQKSGVTVYEFDQYLKGTALAGLGEALVTAEETYSVNAVFLLALAKHESANGTSRLAQIKHNLCGFGARDSDPFNSAWTFDSISECIMVVGKNVANNYLSSSGRYHRGVTLKDINKIYASDKAWGDALAQGMVKINSAIIKGEN